MDGVQVLALEKVAVEYTFNWTAFAICSCSVLAVFIFFGIIVSKSTDDWNQLLIGSIVGVVMGIFFGIITGHALHNPSMYETHYKVTISDEVKINEFLSRYKIIEQHGKIYTIAEDLR